MDSIKFKKATVSDIIAIASIHSASWKNTYRGILPNEYLNQDVEGEHKSLWQKRLSSEGPNEKLILLALRSEIPVGFMCVILNKGNFENPPFLEKEGFSKFPKDTTHGSRLDNLHVLSNYQGQHIGLRLFIEAARWTEEEKSCHLMHLWVLEKNQKARSFYNSLQGKTVGRKLLKFGGVEIPALCYLWDNLLSIIEIKSIF
jgi:ribosomal protein S18 acetylase RimI-like enzyme